MCGVSKSPGEYEGKGSVVDADGWFPTRDAGSVILRASYS